MSLVKVDIDNVVMKKNSRSGINEKDLSRMMDSIKKHGVLNAPGAIRKGKKWYITDGFRRTLACKKLGMEYIVLNERKDVKSGKKALAINLIENLMREDVTPYGQGRAINEMISKHKMTKEEVSIFLSCPVTRVVKLLNIYKLTPAKYRKLITNNNGGTRRKKGTIAVQTADLITDLKNSFPKRTKDIGKLWEMAREQGFVSNHVHKIKRMVGAGADLDTALKRASTSKQVSPSFFVDSKKAKKLEEKFGKTMRDIIQDEVKKNKVLKKLIV